MAALLEAHVTPRGHQNVPLRKTKGWLGAVFLSTEMRLDALLQGARPSDVASLLFQRAAWRCGGIWLSSGILPPGRGLEPRASGCALLVMELFRWRLVDLRSPRTTPYVHIQYFSSGRKPPLRSPALRACPGPAQPSPRPQAPAPGKPNRASGSMWWRRAEPHDVLLEAVMDLYERSLSHTSYQRQLRPIDAAGPLATACPPAPDTAAVLDT